MLPEVIVSKAVDSCIALLKCSLVLVAVAYCVVPSGYGIDTTIGKGLVVQVDNIAQTKCSTAYKEVAYCTTEAEQPSAWTSTHIEQIVLGGNKHGKDKIIHSF